MTVTWVILSLKKVEVEAIGSQTPQTAFAGGDCALAHSPGNRR